MKRKFYLYLFLVVGICSVNAQQVLVTDNASVTTPASGAVLDVNSTNKGFMMPRVDLDSIQDITTVPNRTVGLMVYNTGVGDLKIKGVYFWNGTIWEKELTAGASSTNYVTIADDGTVTLNGGATTFTDLTVPVYAARNSTNTTPTLALFAAPNFFTFRFDQANGDSIKEVFFNVQLPHDYKEGSTLYPHIHWSSITALGATRPVWKLEYQWVNLNENYSESVSGLLTGYRIVQTGGGVESATLATLTDIRRSYITPLGSITGTGKKISSMLLLRLTRQTANINDQFDGGAFLMSFDIHYEIDSFGSKDEYVK